MTKTATRPDYSQLRQQHRHRRLAPLATTRRCDLLAVQFIAHGAHRRARRPDVGDNGREPCDSGLGLVCALAALPPSSRSWRCQGGREVGRRPTHREPLPSISTSQTRSVAWPAAERPRQRRAGPPALPGTAGRCWTSSMQPISPWSRPPVCPWARQPLKRGQENRVKGSCLRSRLPARGWMRAPMSAPGIYGFDTHTDGCSLRKQRLSSNSTITSTARAAMRSHVMRHM